MVTDDDSDMSASTFMSTLATLTEPGFPETDVQPYGFVYHAIAAEADPWNFASPCFIRAAAIGEVHIALQELTGGVFQSICVDDWSSVFDALSAAVVAGTQLPCVYEIPPPPEGMTLDPNTVNLRYTPAGGDETTIPRVDSADDCFATDGWYYDDPENPTQVVACPATCETFESAGEGSVNLAFGCETIIQ